MAGEDLQQAVALHQQGRLGDAERCYRAVLDRDPGEVNALHLLGVLRQQQGRSDEALALIGQALAAAPGVAIIHNNYGNALKELGRLDAAIDSYRQALALDPGCIDASWNLGRLLKECGSFAEAATCFAAVLAAEPHSVEVLNDLGLVLEELDRLDEAVQHYRAAVLLAPGLAVLQHNLGNALLKLGDPRAAEASLRLALTVDPGLAETRLVLGNSLMGQARVGEAIEAYQSAAAMAPDNAQILGNLGAALQSAGRFAEAVECYRQAIARRPEDATLHDNLGTALQALRRPGAALSAYRHGLELRPGDARISMNLGTCLLLMGQLKDGFAAYRSRWSLADRLLDPLDLAVPPWAGEDLTGKTLLIHCEQGFGDSLHFIRYAALMAERAARVLVLTPPALARLFRSIERVEIVEAIPAPDGIDYHAPLLCLPRLLGTELATIPAAVPYLAAAPEQVRRWQERLAPDQARIGLVWAGAARDGDPRALIVDRRRSLDLAALAPLGTLTGVQFVSLQKGPPSAQAKHSPPGLKLFDPTDELKDFADTAALVAALDLVIAVDTSVAHLAGALGKPIWLLSRFDGCWRWLLDRDDSPWYPTLKLFRQESSGAWGPVIDAVAQALPRWLAERGRSR
jgi:tetratricopeptide (TPR) repeat protein